MPRGEHAPCRSAPVLQLQHSTSTVAVSLFAKWRPSILTLCPDISDLGYKHPIITDGIKGLLVSWDLSGRTSNTAHLELESAPCIYKCNYMRGQMQANVLLPSTTMSVALLLLSNGAIYHTIGVLHC